MGLILVDGRFDYSWEIALALFIAAGLTDFFDGYIARRWKITTVLGAFLDSTADKLLVTGTLLALIKVNRASVWIALIIIAREIVVTAIRGIAALQGTQVKPSIWGKWKATIQYVAIALAIVRLSETWGPFYLDQYVMFIAAVVTVASGWQYAKSFWDVVKAANAKPA